MAIELKDAELGGIGKAIHFHEDGAFIRADLPTGTAAVYSDALDLGEDMAAMTLRIVAESTISGAGTGTAAIAFSILGGNDKSAAATGTAWETLATVNVTSNLNPGEEIGVFTAPPGTHKKYYIASVKNGGGATGKFSVWNELTR